jgi:hypothetical protein
MNDDMINAQRHPKTPKLQNPIVNEMCKNETHINNLYWLRKIIFKEKLYDHF